MKNFLYLVASSIAFICLSACGEKSLTVEERMKEGAVNKNNAFPFQVVEEQRAQGRQNAAASAAEYQRQNPRIHGWEAIVKADSSHTSVCPQGDGWAEVVFMRSSREADSTKNLSVEKATVMCSTVSTNEGCVMVSPTDNWSKHPKKIMDGQCASTREVPYPLPKVTGAK